MISYSQNNLVLVKALVLYLWVLTFITFVPSMRKNIRYPLAIHYLIYFSPMLLSPFLIGDYAVSWKIEYVMWGFLGGGILLLSTYRHLEQIFSKENLFANVPLNMVGFIMIVCHFIIALISEELFYRYTLINVMKDKMGNMSVIISAVIFLHSHYANRWANKIFSLKSYIYHFVIGIMFGCLFYKTNSLLSVIVAHTVFNSPQIFLAIKRLYIKQDNGEQLFNDY